MGTNTLAVKIDRSLKKGKSIPVAVAEAWRISFKNAKKVSTIVAISKQQVVGVYSVGSPSLISTGNNAGRVKFNRITPLPKAQWSIYIGMVPFKFHSAIKYL